jgi:hypothetical protein
MSTGGIKCTHIRRGRGGGAAVEVSWALLCKQHLKAKRGLAITRFRNIEKKEDTINVKFEILSAATTKILQ